MAPRREYSVASVVDPLAMRGATLLLAALLGLASPRRAEACEDNNFSRRVTGVATDGSFVYLESDMGGRVYEAVNVADATGKRIAWCELGEGMTGTFESWSCHGDRRFRATRATKAAVVAKAWTALLGATAPLAPESDVPVGVTQAICARVQPMYTTADQIDCGGSNATPLANPSSPLMFLEFKVEPFQFCGGTSSHDEVVWFSRAELAQRLDRRGSLFVARKRWSLATTALEALVWLEPDNAPAARLLERARAAR
jgi:hypothetical protein